MMRRAALALLGVCSPLTLPAQSTSTATQQAESLGLAGRPWHAAETLLNAAAREPRQDPEFIVQGARAELQARRYDRARSLLVGQPWLVAYGRGEALAVLGEAESRLGLPLQAAERFATARALTEGARAGLLAVHAALAFEAAGRLDSAAAYYAIARAGGLAAIEPWLRLREARVRNDTALAFRILMGVPPRLAREAASARAGALLTAGDSGAARRAFHEAGRMLISAQLALALRDTMTARVELYGLFARSPESDDAASGVLLAHGALPPRLAAERISLARVLRSHGAAQEAAEQVSRAVAGGDTSSATRMLQGELLTALGRYREAEAVYRQAARDTAWAPLAVYRRGRVLLRLGDSGATEALAGFAETYPADTAAPTALYLIGDLFADRGDQVRAGQWLGELVRRYPVDARASLARFRLAAAARRRGDSDSAARLFTAEISVSGAQRTAARYWLARLARERADSVGADSLLRVLVREDSIGYYGMQARRIAGLPALRIAADSAWSTSDALLGLARLDTLVLAGLDTEANVEVGGLLSKAPGAVDDLLAWSAGLSARGWGSAAVRLGWVAAQRSPNDARVLRAIFPFPRRAALEAEALEFGVDPWLLAAIVRQESVFDSEALSRAGARGLAQLMPGTAAQAARGLDVVLAPEWLTVPDLNLHLGASHLAALLRRFGGRVEVAVAAYNAGAAPVSRWLARPDASDADQFVEQIPFQETRGYVRSVLRNRNLYRALYSPGDR